MTDTARMITVAVLLLLVVTTAKVDSFASRRNGSRWPGLVEKTEWLATCDRRDVDAGSRNRRTSTQTNTITAVVASMPPMAGAPFGTGLWSSGAPASDERCLVQGFISRCPSVHLVPSSWRWRRTGVVENLVKSRMESGAPKK